MTREWLNPKADPKFGSTCGTKLSNGDINWVLADSKSGYTVQFSVYMRKHEAPSARGLAFDGNKAILISLQRWHNVAAHSFAIDIARLHLNKNTALLC